MNFSDIINLDSYIRISMIREDFENDCQYIGSTDDVVNLDVFESKNIIFENYQLKNMFYNTLNLKDIKYTVINCLSSLDIFEENLHQAAGIVVFDNVCTCENKDILEQVIKYKKKKLLVC